jgi:hypothetical protein
MKLELLTNATVVDDAIRFVASHAAATATEKANSDDRVTVEEEGLRFLIIHFLPFFHMFRSKFQRLFLHLYLYLYQYHYDLLQIL